MDDRVREIFVSEAQAQCELILIGAGQLEEATSGPPEIGGEFDITSRPWFAIQGTVIAAANLSKLFWGSYGSEQTARERADLRSLLGVDADSCLRDRNVRHRFEHFDEDAVEWQKRMEKAGHGYGYVGRNIGGAGGGRDQFAHYDDTMGLVTILGRSLSIPEIVSEARKILPLAKAARGGF